MHPSVLSLVWFAAGALAGGLLATWLGRRGGRAAEDRAAQLEVQVAETRRELEAQRERISGHFARTSALFRELTERYTQLYAHLAGGAREFAGEAPAIARGFEGLLAGGENEAEAGEPAPAAPRTPKQANGGSPPAA
jgi:uncharacterized membrane-anchored protein YhcB (DUF1043 family)